MGKDSHGGNIYKKARELGIREEDILDYSANISPLGMPESIKEAIVRAVDGTVNYPDPDCTALREAIASDSHLKPEWIICGNGGADLLYRVAFGLKPARVLIPVPAFVEYEEAFRAAQSEIHYYYMEDDYSIKEDILEHITDQIDLVVLCNPNNPTGILTERKLTRKIIEKANEVGACCLLDECFLELCENEEVYTLRLFLGEYKNLMILKSFTKLYAMPGVRLGYLLCSDLQVIEKVRQAGQSWSVSHLAQCAGAAALKEKKYKQKVKQVVREELAYMKKELSALPIHLYDGQANYLFFRAPGITDLDRRLERRGILIRNCSNYVNLGDDYWRVAVKSRPENRKFLGAIREIMREVFV